MEKNKLPLEEQARGMKAFAEQDWRTYVDVIFDNIVLDSPDSPLKSALLNGPANKEEEAALKEHNDNKDLAALYHEFTHAIVSSEPKALQRHLQTVLDVLNEQKQSELLRAMLHRFKQPS